MAAPCIDLAMAPGRGSRSWSAHTASAGLVMLRHGPSGCGSAKKCSRSLQCPLRMHTGAASDCLLVQHASVVVRSLGCSACVYAVLQECSRRFRHTACISSHDCAQHYPLGLLMQELAHICMESLYGALNLRFFIKCALDHPMACTWCTLGQLKFTCLHVHALAPFLLVHIITYPSCRKWHLHSV